MPDAASAFAGRDRGIDCARGLAMILVVLGHNAAFAILAPGVVSLVFTFHVPAFFVISGCLLRPDRFDAWRAARRILVPFLLVGIALALAKSYLRETDASLALLGLLWGTGATLPSSQLWFLPALLLTLLASVLLLDVVKRWSVPLPLALLALLPIAWLALQLPAPPLEVLRRPGEASPLGWPGNLDLVPMACFFTLFGFFAMSKGLLQRLPDWGVLPALAVVVLCFALGARTDLNLRVVEAFPLAVAAGIAGSIAVSLAGRWIARHGAWPAAALDVIGRHSMAILAFHVLAQNTAITLATWRGAGVSELVVAAGLGLAIGLGFPLLLVRAFDVIQPRGFFLTEARKCNPRF
ncbi:hypothetical protein EF888_04720 [Silicimonas algicola]|uniref:Fucose 4-O-acetylase-like acetyltransferase n=1 Tax=Silicimonas algicola TaxID=1826607 RepID=A0A316GHI1_9RHOB|nr:acyltransferase family protein [Silicimonas algicola]AZQ66502.1 hypothetical protein EF888_04720 [Silicimonas algicola]PWK58840.1 fucose 4-O-acetylase-like acetyltransferase [Silicimonas algicola]